jgi:hypothetical protein
VTATDVHPKQVGTAFATSAPITRFDLLRAVVHYATNGVPVFPCCPWDGAFVDWEGMPIKAKAPLVRHGFKDASTDIDQIIKWWDKQFPYAMIGRMVPVDQVCIDLDPWKGADLAELEDLVDPLPPTQHSISGRGDLGMHLFFERPLGTLISTKLPKGIDLRVGGNHYTIVAPSVHPESGGQYMWGHEQTLAACPSKLADLLAEPEKPKRKRTFQAGDPFGYVDTGDGPLTGGQIAGILRKVGTAPNGDRNNILHWAACRFFEHDLSDKAIADLFDAALDCGQTKREAQNTIDSASLRYRGVKHVKLW